MSIEYRFIPEKMTYTGKELRSHWAYNNFEMAGDSIVSFIGPARVELTEMVDLKDVKRKSPIYSEVMLHFIAEHFEIDLEKTFLRQQLFISIIKNRIEKITNRVILQKGDDLFHDKRKLSVSIATRSPVSSLIHIGINISNEKTPIKTSALSEFKIEPVRFAKKVMRIYKNEIKRIRTDMTLVRSVK